MFYLKTFGCAQNTADSERVKTYFRDLGYEETDSWKQAETVIINTCIIRESAENRAYGLINNVHVYNPKIKIVVTGCLVGAAIQKKELGKLKVRFPEVHEFMPITAISFELEALRDKKKAALVSISTGCNNHCSFCIVPFSRGKEISRPMDKILAEVDRVIAEGFSEIVLVGQNVNSYGADFGTETMLHMGKKRIKRSFAQLLEQVAKKKLTKISFVSSTPWDFSDELIEVIAKYPTIDRLLHLPFQSGDDEILKKMNRSYTQAEYLELVAKIKAKVTGVRFSTDIIIGFPGETEAAFENTVAVCKAVGFEIAYLNKYSPRSGTVSAKLFKNDVSMKEKKTRWVMLEELVNKKPKKVDEQ